MTIANHIASPDAPSALETAAWHHLDNARGLLDDMNGVVGDPALGQTERAFLATYERCLAAYPARRARPAAALVGLIHFKALRTITE
jgi:hypothetical protein